MKELSIEEKAKRYDEAIERAKEFKNNPFAGYDGTDLISSLFPELVEESEDEKIKTFIRGLLLPHIADVHLEGDKFVHNKYIDNYRRALAWLEKQGEQNLAFIEKGKWYVCIRTSYKPNGKDFIEGKTYYAKEDYKIIGECGEVDIATDNPEEFFRSATEEETNDIIKNFVNGQKPAGWSKEDDIFFKAIIRDIRYIQYISEDAKNDRIKWLKSLKDRVIPQPKQEWSEEDKEKINSICNIIADKRKIQRQGYKSYYNGLINWLRSLRPQSHWKPSEELDEASYHVGIKRVLENPESYGLTKYSWKPTAEQMRVLEWCKPLFAEPESKGILESLIDDLKKLREE